MDVLIMADSRLFKPLRVGNMEMKHRIAMAPMTRMRATDDHVPVPMMKEYYSQRAAVPGTLIISEGTFVSHASCGGFDNAPGIWNQAQIDAWRTITDEVHKKGCFMFCQLFGMGRAAQVAIAEKEGIEIIGPSAIPIGEGYPTPRPMAVEEIKQTVQDFVAAARNAISAGFDGVECHGANGYLIDQFLQDVSNQRNNEYGGTVGNRSRLMHEVLKEVADAVGPERVGFRLSPWSPFQGMKMEDPIPQHVDIISKAAKLNLAYLHVIESRVSGSEDHDGNERLNFAYDAWNGTILVAGGYKHAEARRLLDRRHPDKNIVVMFGREFLANPDLIFRMKKGMTLNVPNRDTFYINKSPMGYVDYPFSPEYVESVRT